MLVAAVNADVQPTNSSTKLGIAWDGKGAVNSNTWSTGKISWYYTWGPYRANSHVEFIPMLWGAGQANDFLGQVNNFGGSTAILGFNEPDNGGQSNLDPATAAHLFQQYLQPLGNRFRLGAPAVTSAPSGKPWLKSFLSACGGCKIDFIPIHWYGSNANEFQNYVADIHNSFGKNIWVTEWACVDYGGGPCGQQNVYDFMGQTTLWLDQQPWVERFSWFGCRVSGIPDTDALLNPDGNSRTGLGNQYIITGGHA